MLICNIIHLTVHDVYRSSAGLLMRWLVKGVCESEVEVKGGEEREVEVKEGEES